MIAIAHEERLERPQALPGLPQEYPFHDWIEYESQDARFSQEMESVDDPRLLIRNVFMADGRGPRLEEGRGVHHLDCRYPWAIKRNINCPDGNAA